MSISGLPTELQELICSFIDNQKDLSRLSQTSKRFSQLTERFLYRSIQITSIAQASRVSNAIKRKDRASLVRNFSIDVYNTNLDVYNWAARQLPEHSYDRDAYLAGLKFNTKILSLFPKIHNLCIHTQEWPSKSIKTELENFEALMTLRSCSLAFKPLENSHRGLHWSLSPWHKLFYLNRLESLELVRAEGDGPYLLNENVDTSVLHGNAGLRSLRLLDCHLSHRWLTIHLRLPVGLKNFEVVVISEKAASFAEHMFLQRCSCLGPLTKTLKSLSYINLRSVPRAHRLHHFAMFEQLTEFSVSAAELFGDTSRRNIETVLQSFADSIPPKIRVLRLYVHRTDLYGDVEGQTEGAWKVLLEMLKPEQKHQVPALREIVLHLFIKDPRIPQSLVSGSTSSGVSVRLATMDEILTQREQHRFRLLMS